MAAAYIKLPENLEGCDALLIQFEEHFVRQQQAHGFHTTTQLMSLERAILKSFLLWLRASPQEVHGADDQAGGAV